MRKLGYSKQELPQAPSDVRMVVKASLMTSKLEYMCTVLNLRIKLDITKLGIAQHKATGFLLGKYTRWDSPCALMKNAHIAT